jgi:hypothetical protein
VRLGPGAAARGVCAGQELKQGGPAGRGQSNQSRAQHVEQGIVSRTILFAFSSLTQKAKVRRNFNP